MSFPPPPEDNGKAPFAHPAANFFSTDATTVVTLLCWLGICIWWYFDFHWPFCLEDSGETLPTHTAKKETHVEKKDEPAPLDTSVDQVMSRDRPRSATVDEPFVLSEEEVQLKPAAVVDTTTTVPNPIVMEIPKMLATTQSRIENVQVDSPLFCKGIFTCPYFSTYYEGKSWEYLLGDWRLTVEEGKKGRNYYVDNCRFWLETLVILKHLMGKLQQGEGYGEDQCFANWWMCAIGGYVGTFHMAFFTVFSGMLSKKPMTPQRLARVVVMRWVPLVTLSLASNLYHDGPRILQKEIANPLTAYTGLWYMQCWVIWQSLTPYLLTLRTEAMVFWSMLFSLLGGYWFTGDSGNILALNNAINLLPFFIAGLVLEDRHFDWARNVFYKRLGAAVSALLLGLLLLNAYYTWDDGDDRDFSITAYRNWYKVTQMKNYFEADYSRDEGSREYWTYWSQQWVSQMLAWVFGLAFVAMIPHERTIFSEFGANTFYSYVLQFYYFGILQYLSLWITGSKFVPADTWHGVLGWMLILAHSVICNMFLSCRFIRAFFRVLFEGDWFQSCMKSNDELKKMQNQK